MPMHATIKFNWRSWSFVRPNRSASTVIPFAVLAPVFDYFFGYPTPLNPSLPELLKPRVGLK
jgi:hypothetical protein